MDCVCECPISTIIYISFHRYSTCISYRFALFIRLFSPDKKRQLARVDDDEDDNDGGNKSLEKKNRYNFYYLSTRSKRIYRRSLTADEKHEWGKHKKLLFLYTYFYLLYITLASFARVLLHYGFFSGEMFESSWRL